MSLVVSLYYGHRPVIDEFCLYERPTNEVFDGRPTVFDMFNFLGWSHRQNGKQMIHQPPADQWNRPFNDS